ncbi:MAG TPA: heme biosynthesis protein HemY, partial [Xanthomonadales bacterium]|nr:heme biosynthesis protein HemY [Xanthomonadales bacterium]
LSRLRRSQALAPAEMERVETRVLTQALAQSPDGAALEATWGEMDRGQRRERAVALAYAQRAAALKAGGAAIGEVEALLGKYWDDALVVAWGRLPGDAEPRLRKAEAWLEAHPNSPGLLLALGELCRRQSLWGKADTYLRRALGAGATADAWEQLGHAYAEQGDAQRAAHAYASALAAQRGEAPPEAPARGIGALIAPIAIVEERNEMGVPRLPG